MASLKELRNRIASVKATQKITKAMQMVAAAKLRRAQEEALAARPYAQRMKHVLSNLAVAWQGRDDAPRLLAGTGSDDTHLLVVATAERGLCGGFNSSIAKLARQTILELNEAGKTVKILCVGKKGADALRREFGSQFVDIIDFRGVRQIGFTHARTVAERVVGLYEEGAFDRATLFYSEFKSVITQIPKKLDIIPPQMDEEGEQNGASGTPYEFEPDEEEIAASLIPRNIAVQIFQALLENAASEQGARMSAMDSATRNAGEMIDKLTLTYNRNRQAQITKELIEIISGAEAL